MSTGKSWTSPTLTGERLRKLTTPFITAGADPPRHSVPQKTETLGFGK
jgi:hypothetical protein